MIVENSPLIMGSSNGFFTAPLRCHKHTSAASCKLSVNIHWLRALSPKRKAIPGGDTAPGDHPGEMLGREWGWVGSGLGPESS